jgi:hypothetical protein
VSDSEAVQSIETAFICQQNGSFFKIALTYIVGKAFNFKTNDPKAEETTIKAVQEHIRVHKLLQKHTLEAMNWLVDFKRGSTEGANEHQQKMVELCRSSQNAWLVRLDTLISLYLQTREVISKNEALFKKFADHKQYLDSKDDTTLVPVIKKLIGLLTTCRNEGAGQEQIQHIWSLSLCSLQAVEVNQLADSEILEKIIDVFLSSSNAIQQTTFTQILKICQAIATTDRNGRFLCKQILKTMSSMRQRAQVDIETEKVVIGCIQGWLDILVVGHVSANSKSFLADTRFTDKIYCTVEADDLLELLIEAGHYLH